MTNGRREKEGLAIGVYMRARMRAFQRTRRDVRGASKEEARRMLHSRPIVVLDAGSRSGIGGHWTLDSSPLERECWECFLRR